MDKFHKVYHEGRWYIASHNHTIFEIIAEIVSLDQISEWVEFLNRGAEQMKLEQQDG